jgi:bacillithiol biosynthesis cysteine-adding enzyme BshC
MEIDCLPFKKTGYFSELICNYLEQDDELSRLYGRFPEKHAFKAQIEEKATSFPEENRAVLANVLKAQYKEVKTSDLVFENISSLRNKKTFTVVTGHQLNLFTGPLYFLYKIVSTINLAKDLKGKFPDHHFVPVYWMATEDHDFDEINYFNFRGKKILWNREAEGAVGRLDTKGLADVFEIFSNALGDSVNAKTLKRVFKEAYLEHSNLAQATRYLANYFFAKEGLVIVDGDDVQLKRLLVPYVKQDIFEQVAQTHISNTIAEIEKLSPNYTIQVNPREINYFYLIDGVRERIVSRNNSFFVNNTDIQFTKEQLEQELEQHPDRFSPNVVARPLYQEVILPNLCYIGGGGEIAYWLELKSTFVAMQVPFPMLLIRNSALVITQKQKKKLQNLNVSISDVFLKQNHLINKKIRQISNIDIDFSPQKKYLEEQFKGLYELAEQTDPSFLGAVKAQEVKQKNGLYHLEKRLLKAQKRKLEDHVNRLALIQNELFPNQSLQERYLNFSELYLDYGEDLLPMLFTALHPLKLEFVVLTTA